MLGVVGIVRLGEGACGVGYSKTVVGLIDRLRCFRMLMRSCGWEKGTLIRSADTGLNVGVDFKGAASRDTSSGAAIAS